MNYYHIWCNLIDGTKDLKFCDDVTAYLGMLKGKGLIEGFRIARRKFGFGLPELGEFHIVIETKDLVQLEQAFNLVATRTGEVEQRHHPVYSAVKDFRSALYRDFPDEVRGRKS